MSANSLFSAKEIKESRKEALNKIKGFLSKSPEEIESQFDGRNRDYYSDEKWIVTWSGKYRGMAMENALELVDSFYGAYSGYKCIQARRNLIYERQVKGFRTIERGLLEVGLKLCTTKKEKEQFFKDYCEPYNSRLRQKQAEDRKKYLEGDTS